MEGREGMEGGGVESRNSAMKTPTHLPTHTYTKMTQRKAVEGKTHKRIRDNSLPSLLSETLDTHTQCKKQKVSRYKEVCVSKHLDSKETTKEIPDKT